MDYWFQCWYWFVIAASFIRFLRAVFLSGTYIDYKEGDKESEQKLGSEVFYGVLSIIIFGIGLVTGLGGGLYG